MNSATLTVSYKNEAGTSIITQETVEADWVINVEREGIPTGATEYEFVVPFAYAKLKGWAISCSRFKGESADKTVLANVKTNSSGSPANEWDITSTSGRAWITGNGTNPIATDVTKLIVTNTGTAKLNFQFRAILDSTPGLDG